MIKSKEKIMSKKESNLLPSLRPADKYLTRNPPPPGPPSVSSPNPPPTPHCELLKLSQIKSVNLKDGDVIIVKSGRMLSKVSKHRIETQIKPIFPDNKILVLDRDLKFEIISSTPTFESGWMHSCLVGGYRVYMRDGLMYYQKFILKDDNNGEGVKKRIVEKEYLMEEVEFSSKTVITDGSKVVKTTNKNPGFQPQNQGYQPTVDSLDITDPPQGGSGVSKA